MSAEHLMKRFAAGRDLAEGEGYDVIVCGGGPSGVAAALSAARAGCRTLVVEATGQLGGVGTSAGVTSLLGGWTRDSARPCIGGIFQEVAGALERRGAAILPESIPNEMFQPFGWSHGDLAAGVYFEAAPMVALLDELMLGAGVDVLFFSGFVDVLLEGNLITHVVVFNKSGLTAVPCRRVIDATGDADVAARAGCQFVKGRSEDGLMTPATLVFQVDQVDQDALEAYMREHDSIRLREIISRLREEGEWPFEFDIFISQQSPQRGTFMINTTRICDIDGTHGRSLSAGMMEGRKQVHALFAIMKKHFPGFQKARIRDVSTMLGVRETRRIVGAYVYSVEDVRNGRRFEDTVGFSGYSFDLPDPKRPSHQPVHDVAPLQLLVTPIPYRVMVPSPVENVICPGRAISVERDVLGILRVMGPCYAMGEAAGLAAALSIERICAFSEVPINELRSRLVRAGAIVDWEE
jgi:hypothetical protein